MATKVRRTVVMLAGLTLATGAVLGAAAPASAAPTTGSHSTTVVARGAYGNHNWGGWDDPHWEFRGLYSSRWECERAGRFQSRGHRGDRDYYCARSDRWRPRWDNNRWGDWRGDWDRGGFRHGAWALYVED
jgi:hypothetical protein